MGSRRKSREIALQALYQSEMVGTKKPSIAAISDNFEVSQKAVPYAMYLIDGVVEHTKQLNEIIQRYAKNWRVDRMSIIDRNLLRLGVYELLFHEDVPASVAINESIEIAKRFSNDESSSFINGILDAINDGETKKV